MTSSEITDDNYGDSCPSCGRARWEHPRDDFPCGQRKASLASKSVSLEDEELHAVREALAEFNSESPALMARRAAEALFEARQALLREGVEVGRLRAELASAKLLHLADKIDAEHLSPLEHKAMRLLSDERATVERLRAALMKYGHHTHPNCHDLRLDNYGRVDGRNGCLCGFDEFSPETGLKPYPVRVHSSGHTNDIHDYEMSDGSIKTLSVAEAKALCTPQ